MNNKCNIVRTMCRILLCSMLFQGCTSYHTYDVNESNEFIAEINEKAETKKTFIKMSNSTSYSVKNLYFKPDSSYWHYEDETDYVGYSNVEINQIVFIDSKKGAWEGLAIGSGIGLLVGIAICTLMGSTMPRDCVDGCTYQYPYDCAFKAGLTLAVISGLIGIPIGAKVGHTDIYTISQHERNGSQSH